MSLVRLRFKESILWVTAVVLIAWKALTDGIIFLVNKKFENYKGNVNELLNAYKEMRFNVL